MAFCSILIRLTQFSQLQQTRSGISKNSLGQYPVSAPEVACQARNEGEMR
jgi:hypothetical protein